MTQINTLLELRTRIKDKKPDFIRQDNDRRMRIGRKAKWRKPKGIHSKIRHHFKGRRKMPSPGYKSPRKVRGLHNSGLKIVKVSQVDDINNINRENEGIIISKNVGIKKRLQILKKAKELQLQALNLNVDEQIRKLEDKIAKKKPETKSKETTKEQKEAVKEPEAKSVLTGEQKKKAEKIEKDKILTKKG